MNKTGGGSFDPSEPYCYFLASNLDRQQWGAKIHEHLLVAINELKDTDLPRIEQWCDEGKKLFIDSGVFTLAMNHAREHNVTHDIALNLAPDDIDGFQELYDRYISIMETIGEKSWGYVEIDQGGRENKLKTRAKLEALGLHPIPVYHPFGDGWDYFDYLAQNYDRICFGNIVQADRETRKRLVTTAWERKRKYPHLWIHLLGLTPNEWLNAFPINSADSSTWLSTVRWSGYIERSDLRSFGGIDDLYRYVLGSNPEGEAGSQKACMMSAYGAMMSERNWRRHIADLVAAGCTILPEVEVYA